MVAGGQPRLPGRLYFHIRTPAVASLMSNKESEFLKIYHFHKRFSGRREKCGVIKYALALMFRVF